VRETSSKSRGSNGKKTKRKRGFVRKLLIQGLLRNKKKKDQTMNFATSWEGEVAPKKTIDSGHEE